MKDYFILFYPILFSPSFHCCSSLPFHCDHTFQRYYGDQPGQWMNKYVQHIAGNFESVKILLM